MGVASWLGFAPKTIPAPWVTAQPIIDVALEGIRGQSVEKLWREQPHLRTVVGFTARNIAQLGWHAYERDASDGRERQRGTPLAQLLSKPNSDVTGYELVYALVSDLCLYDIAYWYVAEDSDAESGWVIRQIPPTWVVGTYGPRPFGFEGYYVTFPENPQGTKIKVPTSDMLVFHGWNPTDPRLGTSPVEALKTILTEQIHAQIYRDQNWKRGGRVGTYLSRPTSAPAWSPKAKQRFVNSWRSNYAGDDAPKAGGEPLLEDGIELKKVGFSAKDDQYIESNKLALSTVAQVFHINPTMVGLLDNANYSNVREFRRMLYGDTLGPLLEMIQQRINTFLVPRITDDDAYVEFNIQSKLAGSFEEQSAVMQAAIGGPWMTVNEGRAKQNLPAIGGGDVLLRNLNQSTDSDTDADTDTEDEDESGSTLPTTGPKPEEGEEDEN